MTARVEGGHGYISEPRDLSLRVEDGVVLRHDVDTLNNALLDIVSTINGRISLGGGAHGERTGNLDAQVLVVLTSTADTDVEVLHGLERVPAGYVVIGIDQAAVVYDSNRESWTSTRFTIRCSEADVTVRLLVF